MKLLITGSSSGMGRWLAAHYCQTGHQVWGIARRDQSDFESEQKASGHSFRATRADVSNWEEMDALRAVVGRDWGSLDGLICCAGIQGPLGAAMKLSPVAWSQSLGINLNGTFYTLLALHEPLRRAERRAKIICFSGGGSTAPRPFFTPYAVAKAAVVRMVENLAHEWAGLPMDINAIAPGAVNTGMTDEVLAAGPAVVGKKEYEKTLEQKQKGAIPLAKVGALIDFLLSPESDRISGRLISGLWDPYRSLTSLRSELEKSDVYTLRRIVPGDRGLDWQ
jgi:NAD(P)-dependent dehydrogenase (short-subunit alcohol dehydrogenase family)